MNFDEIKKQWNLQEGDIVQIKEESLRKTKSITEDIRKKFKKELIITCIAFIYLLYIPFYEDFDEVIVIVYYFVVLQLGSVSLLHFKKLYQFNKMTKDPSVFNSKDNLQKVYYELKYAIDTQKSMGLMIIPLITMMYFVIIGRENTMKWFANYYHFADTMANDPMFFVWNLLGLAFFLGFSLYNALTVTEKTYGKPLNEIKKVLDEIDE